MSWKFWKKKTATAVQQPIEWPIDSQVSVRMLAGMHAHRDMPPFSEWRAEGVVLLPELDELTELGCRGLMLALWFWRFEDVHGAIAGRMVRDEFQLTLNDLSDSLGDITASLIDVMDRSKASFLDTPETARRLTIEGKSIDLPFQWFCALTLLTQTTDSPYHGRDDGEFDGNEMPIMECLVYACEVANHFWEPMVASIGPFNPSSYARWRWSRRPGSFERHLQRRDGNPLFDETRRIVNASDVYYARLRDTQALEDVRREVAAIYDTIKKGDLQIDWHTQLNGLREELDSLSARLAEVDGDCASIEAAIAALREHVIATWRTALADSTDGLAKFDEAEAVYSSSLENRTAWASHLRNPDRPIPVDEFLPSLLSESLDDMRKAVVLLEDSESINETRQACLCLVMRALAEGRPVLEHRQRLAILGVQM
jgi:hypothetical protein